MTHQPIPRPAGLGLLAVSCAAGALLLGACGGEEAPQPPAPAQPPVPAGPALLPAAAPAAPNTDCGPVAAIGATKAKVVIREGAVDCAQATEVLTQYFQQLTPADAAKPDGAGPIVLGGWTCGSGAAGDPTTCSTEDGRQIDGMPVK